MLKLLSFLMVVAFATMAVADAEVPLPGPGGPPTTPAPPQPTPPPMAPTPPPYDPYPTPSPTPTPYPPGKPGQDTTYTLGSGQVGRFKERTFKFVPPLNLRNIRALRVTCTNEKVKLTSVTVTFTDGQMQRQPVLEGLYRTNDTKISYMYSNPVTSVTVTATSSSIFRTNGIFRLDAAAIAKNTADENDPGQTPGVGAGQGAP